MSGTVGARNFEFRAPIYNDNTRDDQQVKSKPEV